MEPDYYPYPGTNVDELRKDGNDHGVKGGAGLAATTQGVVSTSSRGMVVTTVQEVEPDLLLQPRD